MKKIIGICGAFLLLCSVSVALSAPEKYEKKVKIVDDLQFETAALMKDFNVHYFSPVEVCQPLVFLNLENKMEVKATAKYVSPFVDTRYVWELQHQNNI